MISDEEWEEYEAQVEREQKALRDMWENADSYERTEAEWIQEALDANNKSTDD